MTKVLLSPFIKCCLLGCQGKGSHQCRDVLFTVMSAAPSVLPVMPNEGSSPLLTLRQLSTGFSWHHSFLCVSRLSLHPMQLSLCCPIGLIAESFTMASLTMSGDTVHIPLILYISMTFATYLLWNFLYILYNILTLILCLQFDIHWSCQNCQWPS